MKKSLCETTGHDWQTTTASNYRVCLRSDCRAAQHFTGGQWIDVTQRAHPQDDPTLHHQFSLFEVEVARHG